MALPQRQVSGAAIFGLLIAVAIALWLTRYEYANTQTRRNRFTGETEQRVVYGDGSAEWVRENAYRKR